MKSSMVDKVSRFGIAGFGFVGQAVFGSVGHPDEVYVYDKYKDMGTFAQLLKCPFIFCCLPTPQGDHGTQDFTEYDNFLKKIAMNHYEGILIIKSTVLYENLLPYLEKLNIVFNPEFLNQINAVEDFAKQKLIVLGGRIDFCRKVDKLYSEEFVFKSTPEVEFCTLEEAIQIKYMHNIYHAYKVLFWNYVEELTSNSRKISDLYHKVTDRNELSKVCADGKPGYGGACFPKDVNAFNAQHCHKLTTFMRQYNLDLRGDEK